MGKLSQLERELCVSLCLLILLAREHVSARALEINIAAPTLRSCDSSSRDAFLANKQTSRGFCSSEDQLERARGRFTSTASDGSGRSGLLQAGVMSEQQL